ncbi:MAG: bifunctional aspartate kinase/homoserine dehydrogenase I [Spirochaetaceae bacterium]|jgi:aspartokinase/homoserine dehydrogenase 1|nr:bifunctional aspartate kinase/homoserine dehydrogenase I [Spirochaetaceae bacterium]
MLVLKFGGTSVGEPKALAHLINIIKEKKEPVPVMVVSALAGVTDSLVDLGQKAAASQDYAQAVDALLQKHSSLMAQFLTGTAYAAALEKIKTLFGELNRILDSLAVVQELSPRLLDTLMSFGEQFAARLIADILTAQGIQALYLDTRPLMVSDSNFNKAQVLLEPSFLAIKTFFERLPTPAPLYVATGFIARSVDGAVTTLGRGGSDLTATVFGAALDVDEVEIWTDVDGILTADPRMVKAAFKIDSLSYAEAMELSHAGAKVIYPPTIKPALKKGIPIRIRNTFNPAGTGTVITSTAAKNDYPIRGISSRSGLAMVRIQGSALIGSAGFSARLFSALARQKINIILITQSSSEYSLCFAILPQDLAATEAALQEEFASELAAGSISELVSEVDCAVIAIVGVQMKHHAGTSGKIFHALGRNGINIIAIAQGSSELNISAVVSAHDEAKALNAIHEAFFLSTTRSVNLFVVGVGLIGGTLLEQIARQHDSLAAHYQIRINLIGVGNNRKMLFRQDGLDPLLARHIVRGELAPEKSEVPVEDFNLTAFIERMRSFNLPNTAFCDCTASAEIAAHYATMLQAAIAVVTPNKKANSGTLEYYRLLTGYSHDRGIPYLYETTVCAGLPVISTLRDLFLSGDHIRRIEAVVSGTLSFIFNNFDGSMPFSALVREAKAKGYTEPDPRDDLNAMDAARKVLILARECGMAMEFSAVSIEPLLPPACFEAPTLEDFFNELEKIDASFEQRRREAAAVGKALRYVAVIEDSKASISLRAEKADSPFRTLVDSDNMIVITTDRYSKLPMVIKGPGAGAPVTAGGVFADIVRVARTLV